MQLATSTLFVVFITTTESDTVDTINLMANNGIVICIIFMVPIH